MEKFVWSDEYKLGIGIIDEQHQQFFDIVNKIYDLLAAGKNKKEDLVPIIKELQDHAFYHLATEEKYFNQFAFSDIANHMKYHTDFRKKTMEYSDRVQNKNEDLPKLAEEIADFGKNWLTHHILFADILYVPLFKAHGVK